MIITKAVYQEAILPEYRGNPLIEALPAKRQDLDVIKQLSYYPEFSFAETQLDSFERVEYLVRLKSLRQPLPIYLDVFRAVETAIKDSYSAKNPLSPTTMNYLHYHLDKRPEIEPRTGFFKPKGCGITIIGESGVGKTCLLEQVLGCFPDTIEHESYQDIPMPFRQVVWLKVDCPDDSSVRGLCHRILDELDRKLGLEPTKPASTIALLISQIEARIKSSFLGILVIDEMQNLNLAKSGGADRLLGFLHNLVNNLGIPLLFCANPPFNEILSRTLKAARRAESHGYFDIGLMENTEEEWGLFIDELWALQWTNINTPLTVTLSDRLYELSVGNMDLAVRIFYSAQHYIIGTTDERITEQVLELGANITIRASKPATDEIKLQHKLNSSLFVRRRSEQRELQPINIENSLESPTVSIEHRGRVVMIPGDLSRAHHPEFAEQLTALQYALDLYDKIEDPDLIRRASKAQNPLEMLSKAGVFCEDPLTVFS